MEDYRNIHISHDAEMIADEICSLFAFSNKVPVLRLSLFYTLRNYRNDIDFLSLNKSYPNDGANYNVGSIDESNGNIRKIISLMYPDCSTPYLYARVAIIFGLLKIKELIDNNSDFNIADIM